MVQQMMIHEQGYKLIVSILLSCLGKYNNLSTGRRLEYLPVQQQTPDASFQ